MGEPHATFEDMVFNNLKQKIGFTKMPMQPGGAGHDAFLSFLSYTNGQSTAAIGFRREFVANHNNKGETPVQTAAAFIDFLIVNYWGEEPVTDITHPVGQSTPGVNKSV